MTLNLLLSEAHPDFSDHDFHTVCPVCSCGQTLAHAQVIRNDQATYYACGICDYLLLELTLKDPQSDRFCPDNWSATSHSTLQLQFEYVS